MAKIIPINGIQGIGIVLNGAIITDVVQIIPNEIQESKVADHLSKVRSVVMEEV